MKRQTNQLPPGDSVASKMMKIMGYKPGRGLGRDEQGILEPVKSYQQIGRQGLGLVVQQLEDSRIVPECIHEEVVIDERINWLTFDSVRPIVDVDQINLSTWMSTYYRQKLSFDFSDLENDSDEAMMVDLDVRDAVLRAKNVFDNIDSFDMYKARRRSNPYETIQAAIFLNRAAMKMANLDAVLQFQLTNPTGRDGLPVVSEDQLFYFVDACAGPGGFSEYILYRRGWKAKGLGFTLKGDNDFTLEKFFAGPPQCFEPCYGPAGDGNIFNPDNIESFRQMVMRATHNEGVHFMTADGGFSVQGWENYQEIISKQLYLCQCLVALGVVRAGGCFVVKLFDLFTSFSVSLIYLMSHCFGRIAIFKPVTSRPANSERYLLCQDKLPFETACQPVHDYLADVNIKMNEWGHGRLAPTDAVTDIIRLVPKDVMHRDETFMKYIKESSDEIGKRQVFALGKLYAYTRDRSLTEAHRQNDVKRQCLMKWNIPLIMRTEPRFCRASTSTELVEAVNSLVHGGIPFSQLACDPSLHFRRLERCIPPAGDEVGVVDLKEVSYPLSWSAMPLYSEQVTYILSLGRDSIFVLDRQSSIANRLVVWHKLFANPASDQMAVWNSVGQFQLPRMTLIMAEVGHRMSEAKPNTSANHDSRDTSAKEYMKTKRRQIAMADEHGHVSFISICDVLFIHGEDFRHLSLCDRLKQARLLAEAVNRASVEHVDKLSRLTVKTVFPFESVASPDSLTETVQGSCSTRLTESEVNSLKLNDDEATHYAQLAGLILYRDINQPYEAGWSKKEKRPFFFLPNGRVRSFWHRSEAPHDIPIDVNFDSGTKSRLVWLFPAQHSLANSIADEMQISLAEMATFIQSHVVK